MNFVKLLTVVLLANCVVASAQVQRYSYQDKSYTYGTTDTIWVASPGYPGYRSGVTDGQQVMGDTTDGFTETELPKFVGYSTAGRLLVRMIDAVSDSVRAYMKYIMHDTRVVAGDSTFIRGSASTYGVLQKDTWITIPFSTVSPRPHAIMIVNTVAETDSPLVAGKRIRWEVVDETITHQDF